MFFTYILQSEKTSRFYVGHTHDLSARLDYHNAGNVKSTKSGIPWVLVHSETYANRGLAMSREAQIKAWKSAKAIRQLIQTTDKR